MCSKTFLSLEGCASSPPFGGGTPHLRRNASNASREASHTTFLHPKRGVVIFALRRPCNMQGLHVISSCGPRISAQKLLYFEKRRRMRYCCDSVKSCSVVCSIYSSIYRKLSLCPLRNIYRRVRRARLRARLLPSGLGASLFHHLT